MTTALAVPSPAPSEFSATLRRAIFFALPALAGWYFAAFLLYPKLQHVWANRGFGGTGAAAGIFELVRFVCRSSPLLAIGLVAALVALNLIYRPARRWRAATAYSFVFVLNWTVFATLALMCVLLVLLLPG
jgi:hypothetical protein